MRLVNVACVSIVGVLAVAGLQTGGGGGSMAACAAPQPTASPISSSAAVSVQTARTATFHWHYREVRGGRTYDYDIHGTTTAAVWKATLDDGTSHILAGTVSLLQYQQFLAGLVQRHIWTASDHSKSPRFADLPTEDVTLSVDGRSRQLPLLAQTGDGDDPQLEQLVAYLESSMAARPLHQIDKDR